MNAFVDISPAIDHGILYEIDINNLLYAFNASGCNNASSCLPLWTKSLDKGGTLVVTNGIIYVASSGKVEAYNASNCNSSSCQLLWTATSGSIGATGSTSLAVAYGVVYLGSQDGKVYAFKSSTCTKSSCSPLWTASTQGSITSPPFVANGVVYTISADGKIYAFNALGCEKTSCLPLWQFPIGKTIGGSLMVANGAVYVASSDHKMYAFHLPGRVA